MRDLDHPVLPGSGGPVAEVAIAPAATSTSMTSSAPALTAPSTGTPPAVAPPAKPGIKHFGFHDLLAYDLITSLIEGGAYGLSLVVGILVVRWIHPSTVIPCALTLLAAAISGMLTFLATLILLRRTLFRTITKGRYLRTSAKLYPWSFSIAVNMIFYRSPFSNLVNGNILLRLLFYRGIGLRMPWSVYIGQNVKIVDPWLTVIGPGSLLGEGAIISCHKVDRDVVTLEPVTIGANVLVGAMAHIQPGVRIDDHAVIGANALVMRGTHVRAGECWMGNPATRLDLVAQIAAMSRRSETAPGAS